MSTFKLSVDTDNAAFDPDPRPELARILRRLAERVEDGTQPLGTVMDADGNTVGSFALGREPTAGAASCWCGDERCSGCAL